jgi:hypothetical protein
MKKYVICSWLTLAGLAMLGLAAAPSQAQLVITPTFDSTITGDPNAAAIEGVINGAILDYGHTFTDPINVTINFREMTSGLGQSQTTLYATSYQTFINALTADATSADDATALAHLPNGATNPVTGSTNMLVKTANIRALGIPGSFPPMGGFDGVIGLNTHFTDIGSPGTAGIYSLLAVTEHEIDEVLGLGSALPNFSTPTPEDLYRYDANGNRSFTTNGAAKAYFSINGTTDLAQFDNQNDGGDFGDWQSNPLPPGVQPKVQDAFATPGTTPSLGVELRALDVIGYNLAPTSVPEPSSVAFLSGMFLSGAFLMRRRLRK